MSMQWITLRQAQEDNGGTVVVQQHWYLTEDKTRVVAEGDPDGRWLWASPGTAVPLNDAIRYGAVKVQAEQHEAPVEPVGEARHGTLETGENAAEVVAAPEAETEAEAETVTEASAEPGESTERTDETPPAEDKPKARKQSANKSRAKAEDK